MNNFNFLKRFQILNYFEENFQILKNYFLFALTFFIVLCTLNDSNLNFFMLFGFWYTIIVIAYFCWYIYFYSKEKKDITKYFLKNKNFNLGNNFYIVYEVFINEECENVEDYEAIIDLSFIEFLLYEKNSFKILKIQNILFPIFCRLIFPIAMMTFCYLLLLSKITILVSLIIFIILILISFFTIFIPLHNFKNIKNYMLEYVNEKKDDKQC